MILPEHKFIVVKITDVLTTRNKKNYRELILKKNAPTDEFGEPIGKDDILRVTIWEKQMDMVKDLKAEDKVQAQLYMNCSEGIDQNTQIYYAVNFSIRSLKIYTPEAKS